ncbi:MAG: hypothetical protein ACOYOQ_15180, partial [Microthrixaceae bacterium]
MNTTNPISHEHPSGTPTELDEATLVRTPNPVGEHLLLSGDLHDNPRLAANQLARWVALGVTG